MRSTDIGDTARAAYVGEVLGNFDGVLHIHHEGEDLLMYPQLAGRAPGCVLHVAQMLEQHRQVGERLDGIEPIRRRWMETADAAASEELAERYEDLSALLKVHLRREVTEVMPVVDRVLSEKEMDAVGQHGIEQFDKKFLVGYLGMMMATNPPDDLEHIDSSGVVAHSHPMLSSCIGFSTPLANAAGVNTVTVLRNNFRIG